ncbi:hypothetical protein GQ42DRAFT_161103 [Ramicandelaber brevisporus]|nr:hypothetical protein GQ42DRAFT_161103 [Ramicandelaber brevisporus]
MRFIAIAALVAAAASSAVSAVNVIYGSRGIVPVNYGSCRNAKAVPHAIIALESSVGNFLCNSDNADLVNCAGFNDPKTACPALRNRCETYQGTFVAVACASH